MKVIAQIAFVCSLIPLVSSGCDFGSPERTRSYTSTRAGSGRLSRSITPNASGKMDVEQSNRMTELMHAANRQIESAVNDPGGENMAIATDDLNEYFEAARLPASNYRLPAREREFLDGLLAAEQIKKLEERDFSNRDGRHLEDCILYQTVARRVAGRGDDLTRVRRLFEWTVNNIVLAPPQMLASSGLPQAQARPHDVLFRAMATEEPQSPWAERGWLFIALCRQLNLDAGLLCYTPRGADAPVIWIPGVVIDEKVYLFDTRIGMEIPSPSADRPATLEEAATENQVLEQLDLPGISYYGVNRADLNAGKIDVLIDSSPGYFAPRMRLLQERLLDKSKMILYREGYKARDAFAKALGKRLGSVRLWTMPITVFENQFTSSEYTTSLIRSMVLFSRELPMLKPRLDQLRGDVKLATQEYVVLRMPEFPIQIKGSKETIPDDIQYTMDLSSTYFLAFCKLDEGTPASRKAAKDLFRQALKLFPEEGPGRLSVYMYRRGAAYVLARLEEEDGNVAEAVRLYSLPDPTPQAHGRALRARALIWKDPFLPPAPRLAPAPEQRKFSSRPNAAAANQPRPVFGPAQGAIPGPPNTPK